MRVLPANLVEEEGGKMERMKEEKEKADAIAGQFFSSFLARQRLCLRPTKKLHPLHSPSLIPPFSSKPFHLSSNPLTLWLFCPRLILNKRTDVKARLLGGRFSEPPRLGDRSVRLGFAARGGSGAVLGGGRGGLRGSGGKGLVSGGGEKGLHQAEEVDDFLNSL